MSYNPAVIRYSIETARAKITNDFYWLLLPKPKTPLATAGDAGDVGSIPGSGRFPWKNEWQPTPVFFPGESHGQRSLPDNVQKFAKCQTQVKQHAVLIIFTIVVEKKQKAILQV